MSIVGFYFVSGLLREAGWPRKQGILKREVIDTAVLDSAMDQMIVWSAALGAGRPKLALQIIAHITRDKDWEGEDAPNIKMIIDGSREAWDKQADAAPSAIIQPTRFAKHFGTAMALKDYSEARTGLMIEQHCLEALLWGLANAERFRSWYVSYTEHIKQQYPLMKDAALAVDSPPELPQFLEQSEDILRGYERELSPLPPIPPKLLADARAIGRELGD